VTAECSTKNRIQLEIYRNFDFICQNWNDTEKINICTWPVRRIDWLVELSAQDNIWFAHRLLQGHGHVMQTNQATQFDTLKAA